MTFDVITVGEPYPQPELVEFEGVGWHSDGRYHQIVAALNRPTNAEIAGLVGDYALAFCHFDGVLFALLNPVDGWWIECPWAPLATGDTEYQHPDTSTPGHQVVAQVVVDSHTGIVVNNRLFTLSEHATNQLQDVMTTLINGPRLTPDAFVAKVTTIRQRFPRTEDMLPHAFVRTRTGQ